MANIKNMLKNQKITILSNDGYTNTVLYENISVQLYKWSANMVNDIWENTSQEVTTILMAPLYKNIKEGYLITYTDFFGIDRRLKIEWIKLIWFTSRVPMIEIRCFNS